MRTGLMATVVGLAGSLALGSGVSAGSENAALEYYKAWLLMDSELQLGLIADDDEFALSEDGASRLEASQPVVEMLIDAARLGDADWDVNYDDGPGALLPHLGRLRASARVIGADAIRCMDAGDSRGAAMRIATLFRMGDDVTGDRILISSLVGMAIGNEAVKLANHFIEQGSLNPGDARVILSAIHEGDAQDRYAMREAIIGEWRIMSDFIIRQQGKHAGKMLLETMMLDADSKPTEAIAAMSRADLLRALGGFAAYHGDILDAWEQDDLGAMQQIEKKVENGDYGVVTQVLGASLTRSFNSTQSSRKQIHELINKLEEIAD